MILYSATWIVAEGEDFMEKKALYFLSMGHLCCDINTGALPALLPFFVSLYGMDYKLAAGLMFAASFLSSLIQPLFGYLADRVTRPWFMAAGVLVSGVALGVTGILGSYPLIFAAVTCMGIGNAVFHPEAARLVNQISGQRKAFGMSIFSVGGNGGFCLGPILAVAVVSLFGLSGTILFGGLAVIMSAALFVMVPRIKVRAEKGKPLLRSNGNKAGLEAARNDWSSFSRLSIVIVLRSIAYSALQSFLPLYCVYVLGQTNATGSFTLTILAVMGVLTTWLGGLWADRIGNVRVIRYCMLLAVVLLAVLATVSNMVWFYALLIPLGFTLFASSSPSIVLGQTYLAKNIGFASGITMGIGFSVGGAVAPLLGWIGDLYGLPMILKIVVVVAALGAAAACLLKEPSREVVEVATDRH